MAAKSKPALDLFVDLDERIFSEDLVEEMKKSYSGTAPCVIEYHVPSVSRNVERSVRDYEKAHHEYPDYAAQEDYADIPIENTITLKFSMRTGYEVETRRQFASLWKELDFEELNEYLNEVAKAIRKLNESRQEKSQYPINYEWVDVELEDEFTFSIKTLQDSFIPAKSVEVMEEVRHLESREKFGMGMTGMSYPAKESYERQKDKVLTEALIERDKDRQSQLEAADNDRMQSADDAVSVMEDDEWASMNGQLTDDFMAQRAMEAAFESDEQALMSKMNERLAEEPGVLPHFDVDYRIWGIEYANGTERLYDSRKREFVD
ncbi:MAG: hypothetical protein LUB61_04855 [Eggerthellaceae bacterium]|nr:hypothetical protein [Eggerthellaceae bacterium]